MCQPKKWWQGLVPLAILWLLTIWFKTGAVEANLTNRTSEALKGVMLDAPNITLSGRDANVLADAFSADGQHAAIAAVEQTTGIRRVTDATKLVPEMHPYAWAAQRTDHKLTLTGNAPAPDVRAQILDAAKKAIPGGEVIDQMAWARGAPTSFAALSALALAELGKLSNGLANLSDGQIAISGEAPTSDAYGRVVSDLTKLPDGGSLGKIAIVPPEAKPYAWGAARDGNRVTLSGNVSVPLVRADLVAAAKKAFPGADIVDQMTWARGAPADLSALTGFLLSELTKLSNGKVNLSDKQITIEGEAPTAATYDQILTDLKSPPADAVLAAANVQPPEVKPYAWSLSRDGRTVTLSGNVPAPEARGQLVQAVRKVFPDAEVTDHLTYGRGAPAAATELTNFGLMVLAKLGKGEVRFSDEAVAIEGEAPTSAAYEDVLADLTKLPDGATLTKADVLPPLAAPFSLKGSKEGGSLTLTGAVPSGDTRTLLVETAKKTVPNVIDNLTYARGAPEAFNSIAAFGLSEISQLASGTFALVDDQLSIAGEAPSSAAYEQVIADLKKLPAGAKLGRADIVPPLAKPYSWSAVRDGQTVTLSGSVPNSGVRAQILAAAKALPGANAVDHLNFARGAPADFVALTSFGLIELGKVAKGSVAIVDQDISIAAEAPTSAIYEQLLADLHKLPEAASLSKADILPPIVRPYLWSITRDGNSVTLAGNVPTPDTRTQLVEAAKTIGPNVTDQMNIARGAPGNFATLLSFSLDSLSKLAKGSIAVADTQLRVEGEAATSNGFDQLINSLKKLPEGVALTRANVVPPLAPIYGWSARRDGAVLTMTGNVPSPEVRETLVDLAKQSFAGVKIDDQMAYARGAPDNFATFARFGLDALSKLAHGNVGMTGNQLFVDGEAATSNGFEQLTNSLKKAPQGANITKANVLPPTASPYIWSARRDNATVTMTGNVPSPERRTSLEDLANKLFAGSKIDDRSTYARGEPGNFATFTSFGLDALSKLAHGSVAMTGNQLSIEGEAATSNGFEQLTNSLKKPPQGADITKANVLPPTASPYTWSAKRDNATVTMTGNVPSRERRTSLEDLANKLFAGSKIDDQTTYARGEPGNFATLSSVGLNALGKLARGTVAITGNQLTIDGEAADANDFDELTASLKKLPEGITLGKADVLPPLASPYLWSVKRNGAVVTMTGSVPAADVRANLVNSAKKLFAGAEIDDQMTYARGAPDNWSAAAQLELQQLAKLKEGQASLNGTSLSLSGAAADPSVRNAVDEALQTLPTGFALANHAIAAPEPTPPPAPILPPAPPASLPPSASAAPAQAFRAVREAGVLTLSGSYPDEKAHEEIIDAAQRKFFSEAVVDQMHQSDDVARPAVNASLAGLDELARLASGSVAVSGSVIKLSGAAFYSKAAEQIQSAARASLPPGFKIETDLTVKPPDIVAAPDACEKLFVDLVSRGRIRFETGQAIIQKDSFGLLDFAVYNALRCQAGNIEIAGHTDSDGSKEANMDLSKRRAQAVVDYLVNAGIDPQRLSSVGFGDTHPVTSNDTEEGKAENGRIEFSVR